MNGLDTTGGSDMSDDERDMTPEESDAAYDAADAVPMDETHINKVLAFVLERALAMTDSPPATQTENSGDD